MKFNEYCSNQSILIDLKSMLYKITEWQIYRIKQFYKSIAFYTVILVHRGVRLSSPRRKVTSLRRRNPVILRRVEACALGQPQATSVQPDCDVSAGVYRRRSPADLLLRGVVWGHDAENEVSILGKMIVKWWSERILGNIMKIWGKHSG